MNLDFSQMTILYILTNGQHLYAKLQALETFLLFGEF
jgi:hypothetical protein